MNSDETPTSPMAVLKEIFKIRPPSDTPPSKPSFQPPIMKADVGYADADSNYEVAVSSKWRARRSADGFDAHRRQSATFNDGDRERESLITFEDTPPICASHNACRRAVLAKKLSRPNSCEINSKLKVNNNHNNNKIIDTNSNNTLPANASRFQLCALNANMRQPPPPPPAYYYDTSPDGAKANDALTVSSTANTVAADSDASPPSTTNDGNYATGDNYGSRLPRLQQLQSQRLIFPPPPPAPPPPPIFPPPLNSHHASRLYPYNQHGTYSSNSCDDAPYQCTDPLTYSHHAGRHYHHHLAAGSSLSHGAHIYGAAPDGCHKASGADFALLGSALPANHKCSPSTSATSASDASHSKQRLRRASTQSGERSGSFGAMFRAAPKTCILAVVSFTLLIAAVFFLLLQRHNEVVDYRAQHFYGNDQNGLLYGSCADENHKDNNRANNNKNVPLPREIHVGESVYADLPPRRIVYTGFSLAYSAHIVLNISVLPHARLVIYGRQTLAPTPAQHAFQQIVAADRLHVGGAPIIVSTAPSPQSKVLKYAMVAQFLSAGRWFFGFLNDHHAVMPVSLTVSITTAALHEAKIRLDYDGTNDSGVSTDVSAVGEEKDSAMEESEGVACRFDCFGKGVCVKEKCRCHPGYSGKYCEQTSCPVLCSGNGIFANGVCVCHEGFKGAECDTVANWCTVPDCNSHGSCGTDGQCHCAVGWEGEFCERRACQPDADCSSHGVCHDGRCYCTAGRWGDACERRVADACVGQAALFGAPPTPTRSTDTLKPKCLPGCERHGVCRAVRHRRVHSLHKRAVSAVGASIQSIFDDSLDIDSDYDICECHAGWSGANCQVPACGLHNCGVGGDCVRDADGRSSCVCDAEHFGEHCQFRRELFCDDGLDNDGDGLKDCEDSWECCSHATCAPSPLCLSSIAPHVNSTVVSKQLSFLSRYRFLFEPAGPDAETTQRYADAKNFDARHVSVLRGRVLSAAGGPLTGVRVSDARNAHYGFTITRGSAMANSAVDESGVFDLAVNGGETIELLFLRQPYLGVKRSFTIGVNEVFDVGDIFLDKPATVGDENQLAICRQRLAKAQQKLTPTVTVASRRDNAGSIANITLLGNDIPPALRVIHVELRVAGHVKKATLAAQPRLRHAFEWDRHDVYGNVEREKTFGNVRIGYEYESAELCASGGDNPQLIGWRELSVTFDSLS